MGTLIIVRDGHRTEVQIDGKHMTLAKVNAALDAAGVLEVRAVDPSEFAELNRQREAQSRARLLDSLSVEEPSDIADAKQMLGIRRSGPLDTLSTKDLESIRSMLEPDSY